VAPTPVVTRAEPLPHNAPSSFSVSSAVAPTIESLGLRWRDLARHALSLGELDLGTALAGSQVTALTTTTIAISCERSLPESELPRLRQHLASLGIGHLQPVITVTLPGREGDSRARKLTEAKNHPLVKDALKRFEADVHLFESVTRAEWQARLERPT